MPRQRQSLEQLRGAIRNSAPVAGRPNPRLMQKHGRTAVMPSLLLVPQEVQKGADHLTAAGLPRIRPAVLRAA